MLQIFSPFKYKFTAQLLFCLKTTIRQVLADFQEYILFCVLCTEGKWTAAMQLDGTFWLYASVLSVRLRARQTRKHSLDKFDKCPSSQWVLDHREILVFCLAGLNPLSIIQCGYALHLHMGVTPWPHMYIHRGPSLAYPGTRISKVTLTERYIYELKKYVNN